MAKISPLDILFVTVVQNGITRLNSRLTGVSSLGDIVRNTRMAVPGLTGLATIGIRNSTEGWSSRQSVFIV